MKSHDVQSNIANNTENYISYVNGVPEVNRVQLGQADVLGNVNKVMHKTNNIWI